MSLERAVVAGLVASWLLGCSMSREQVLEGKRCEPGGVCAFGYRCESGTCVEDRAAPRDRDDAGSKAPASEPR